MIIWIPGRGGPRAVVSLNKKDLLSGADGFTGLEAAIVLIAFVVVAAVFSYVILGAGFMVTQKTQNVIISSVAQVGSTVVPVGGLYGTGSGNCIASVNFSVTLSAGGMPSDFDRAVLVFSNSTTVETLERGTWGTLPAPGQWTVTSVQNEVGRSNHELEAGEQFQISAVPSSPLCRDGSFLLELRPASGVALEIRGSVPHTIGEVNRLA